MKTFIDSGSAGRLATGPSISDGEPAPGLGKPGHHSRGPSRILRAGFLFLPALAAAGRAGDAAASDALLSAGSPDLPLLVLAMMGVIVLSWRP